MAELRRIPVYHPVTGAEGDWWPDIEPKPGGYLLAPPLNPTVVPPSYDSYAGGVGVDIPKTTFHTMETEKFKPIIAENVFSKVFDVIKQTLEDSAVRLISDNKKVQEKIEEQKVVVGKEVLWKYIPFILIGVVLLALIVRFK